MKFVHSLGGKKITGPGLENTASVTLLDNPIPIAGSSYNETIEGIEFLTNNSDSTENSATLLSTLPVSIENLTPAVSYIDDHDIRHVSDGEAKIRTDDGRTKKVISHNISISPGSTVQEPTGYSAGTLAKHVQEQFSALNLPASPSASDVDLITNYQTGEVIIKNPNNFVSSNFDDSGIGYRNTSPYAYCTAAISPRHIITSAHTLPGGQDLPIQFVDTNGVVHQRIVNATFPIVGFDVSIGYLTQALPPEVTPIKVLPADFDTKLNIAPIALGGSGACVNVIVYSNRLDRVGIRKMAFNDLTHSGSPNYNICRMFVDSTLSSGYHNTSAASSSMVVMPINGELVLMTSYWSQTYDWLQLNGEHYAKLIDEINAQMTASHGSSEHQLQTVDLSGFVTI